MDILVAPAPDGTHRLSLEGFGMRCAVGRSGLIAAAAKREGDGGTPVGRWPIRRAFYRPDRLPRPETRLPVEPLEPDMGWCDDPASPDYNRLVRLPFGPSHEAMWREDSLYDVVVVVGHNDDPVEAGAGSAIFLHLSRTDYAPTAGCVAVTLEDMMKILALAEPGSALVVAGA